MMGKELTIENLEEAVREMGGHTLIPMESCNHYAVIGTNYRYLLVTRKGDKQSVEDKIKLIHNKIEG